MNANVQVICPDLISARSVTVPLLSLAIKHKLDTYPCVESCQNQTLVLPPISYLMNCVKLSQLPLIYFHNPTPYDLLTSPERQGLEGMGIVKYMTPSYTD